jgi:diadenosine tetraphosphate (Ap4A) HIT family hydrolase
MSCRFCVKHNPTIKKEIVARTRRLYAVPNRDWPGGLVIIPFKHIEGRLPNWWQREVNKLLAKLPEPSKSYNLSVNIGEAAGQTMIHIHGHYMPRDGDEYPLGLVSLRGLVEILANKLGISPAEAVALVRKPKS